jgi:hypothetical protein
MYQTQFIILIYVIRKTIGERKRGRRERPHRNGAGAKERHRPSEVYGLFLQGHQRRGSSLPYQLKWGTVDATQELVYPEFKTDVNYNE